MAGGSGGTIAERLEGREGLTPAGELVARALLADYPAAGLDTVASLAQTAGVSAPSVVRFVSALGFSGFRAFQDALRDELAGRDASALSQARTAGRRTGEPIDAARRALVEGLDATIGRAPRAELAAVVALLSAPGRRLLAVGGDYSSAAAAHLVAQLAPLRPGVRQLPPSVLLTAIELADLERGDVVVIFDVRRYQPRMRRIAEVAGDRGARIVLVTDRWRSPVADLADHVLIARVESAGASDTLVPALGLVEALSEAVERRLGQEGIDRLARIDPIRLALEGLGGEASAPGACERAARAHAAPPSASETALAR
ncbi:MurR/RpiR family transcriptional regulator [Micrococcus luteus]|uniref:MurR/RpiR family transcriptional regulator n=1 Tax=Micrococcus luteus TaxID=1270 RepID=UPI0033E3F7EE